MTTPLANNVFNRTPYLRTSRDFPEDPEQMSIEVNKTYVDIANAVNNRTISTFVVNRPVITGENWYFLNNQKQQTLRQIYTFTSTASINHGINGLNGINPGLFSRAWGTFTDGTNGYGLIFASNVAIAGQITFYLTSTQIVFLSGAGSPALTSGRIVLEWLSAV